MPDQPTSVAVRPPPGGNDEPEFRPPRICPFCRVPLPLAFDCMLCDKRSGQATGPTPQTKEKQP